MNEAQLENGETVQEGDKVQWTREKNKHGFTTEDVVEVDCVGVVVDIYENAITGGTKLTVEIVESDDEDLVGDENDLATSVPALVDEDDEDENESVENAEYSGEKIEEVEPEAGERRFEGEVAIRSDNLRTVHVRRTWEVDDDGVVHEWTHYYSSREISTHSHLGACSGEVEWEPSGYDDLRDELMGNLTQDATAELDGVLADISEETARKKIGLGEWA
jgi:hypothetical protein